MFADIKIIDERNYQDTKLREYLYGIFGYDKELEREADFGECVKVTIEDPDIKEATSYISRINWFEKLFKERTSGSPPGEWQILDMISKAPDWHILANEVSRVMLDIVAPAFFSNFPGGQIWFVEVGQGIIRSFWESERNLNERLQTTIAATEGKKTIPNISLPGPQEFSGYEGGASHYWMIKLMLEMFWPYINGRIFTAMAGDFLFLPETGLSMITDSESSLYEQVRFDFIDVFNDQWTFDGRGAPKSGAPEECASLQRLEPFYRWYLGQTAEFVRGIADLVDDDLKTKLILTVNSMVVDISIANNEELPYIFKVFFYHSLDKFCSILSELRFIELAQEPRGRDFEAKLWERVLSKEFFEEEVIPSLSKIPSFGDYFVSSAEWTIKEVHEYSEISVSLLRGYRNIQHGYFGHSGDVVFQHSGEIHNDIPSLMILLWLYLLSSVKRIQWEAI